MKNNINQKGFTLIELLVVVMVLGILAGMAFALINPVALFGQARDATRKADLKAISNALQLYYNDNKVYPTSGSAATLTWVNAYTLFNSGTYALMPNYMRSVPKDPLAAQSYQYASSGTYGGCTNNQSFALSADLERANDTQAYPNKTLYWCDGTTVVGGTSGYYYVTSS